MCFPTLKLKWSSNLTTWMNHWSQHKKNIFFIHTSTIKLTQEFKVKSVVVAFSINYSCKCVISYTHKLPNLYMALLSHQSSDYLLPLQGFINFYDTVRKTPTKLPWQHACGQLDSQEDQSKMLEDQGPLSWCTQLKGGDTWKEDILSDSSSYLSLHCIHMLRLLYLVNMQEVYRCSGEVKWLENRNLHQEALESHTSVRSVAWWRD